MATTRYITSPILRNGKMFGTNKLARRIYLACESGALKCKISILSERQRLDHVAGIEYGEASLWWIIAAASGIGWGLQLPPGTSLRIPINPDDVYGII
jgi:hypothetical protein